MKINTRFNLRDEIFFLYESEITRCNVSRIEIEVLSDNEVYVKYKVYIKTSIHKVVSQENCYASAQELCDALQKNFNISVSL